MATPLAAAPAVGGYTGPGRAQERPGTRQAILEAIFALDQAKAELQRALSQPVIDTCGVFVTRAGTQIGHARNNLLRAHSCLQAPAEVRPYMSFRKVPTSPPRF